MKKLLLACIATLLSVAAFAQTGTVKGRILDDANGEGLIGANVVLKGTVTGAMTDINGNFTIQNVAAGKQTFVVSFIGYLPQEIQASVKANGTTDLGSVVIKADAIGLTEVEVVAAIAQDRKTPVSVSNVKADEIEAKLGGQEFPEILKVTPGVYATKGSGGGFGDSRINLRGFDSNNIGVLINGVPVNDMENGRVYWSNWAGLSDVTRTMQVQRGLGYSRLAISSVGGTINIVTKSTDAVKGGSAYVGVGNNGYLKTQLTLSTGLMDNGFAVTASGARTSGNGYIDGTNFEAYNYFLSVAKKINEQHEIVFTGFGAPQWHHQRNNFRKKIEDYANHPSGHRANWGLGYRDGEVFGGSYAKNFFHKPQLSLNHYWTISENTTLSTAVYASMAGGGGRRTSVRESNYYDENLAIQWDKVEEENELLASEGKPVSNYVFSSRNNHNWYGMLSTLNTKVNERLTVTGGLDARYYLGKHYRQVDDLLGGTFAYDLDRDKNPNNINSSDGYVQLGDKIQYYDHGRVNWLGLFGQAEYAADNYSAFITGTVSGTSYHRTDFFNYTPGNQESETLNYTGYSLKGGFNYNLSDHHNVFINGGSFSRAPFMNIVFAGNTNTPAKDLKNEQAESIELGYGLRTAKVAANVALYRTMWRNKAFSSRMQEEDANGLQKYAIINGQNALHQGIELDVQAKPVKNLSVTGMVSLGDWKWKNDVEATITDDAGNIEKTITTYAAGLHVGDAAQTTMALMADYTFLNRFTAGFTYNYFDRLYASFDPSKRTDPTKRNDAWKLPSFQTLDLNLRYNVKVFGLNTTLYGNINNLLNEIYISDAIDGSDSDAVSSYVYYSYGRTWNTGLRVRF